MITLLLVLAIIMAVLALLVTRYFRPLIVVAVLCLAVAGLVGVFWV